MLIACLLQFVTLFYNPIDQLPSKNDLEAGQSLIRIIKNIEGEVFLPYHGFLPTLAGKSMNAHSMAIADILRGEDEDIIHMLQVQMTEAILRKRFDAIILDNDWWGFDKEILKEYSSSTVFIDPDVFWPVTGMETRPESIYILTR